MADLRDQLRAYGRQIENALDKDVHSTDPDGNASDVTSLRSAERRRTGPPGRRSGFRGRNQWLLVAATTAAIVVLVSLLPILTRLEDEDMRKGSATIPGFCLFAAACGTDTTDAATSTGPGSTPPSATSAPTAPTSGGPLLEGPTDVEPGTYVVDKFGTPIHVTMPAGWERRGDVAVAGPDDAVLAFSNVASVYTDACNWIDNLAPIGPTVDDFVQALQSQQNSLTSAEPLDIDGFSGYKLVVSTPAGVDIKKCYGGARGIWKDVDGQLTDTMVPGSPITVWVLDLDGQRAVISATSYKPMGAQAQAELSAMTDSISIG